LVCPTLQSRGPAKRKIEKLLTTAKRFSSNSRQLTDTTASEYCRTDAPILPNTQLPRDDQKATNLRQIFWLNFVLLVGLLTATFVVILIYSRAMQDDVRSLSSLAPTRKIAGTLRDELLLFQSMAPQIGQQTGSQENKLIEIAKEHFAFAQAALQQLDPEILAHELAEVSNFSGSELLLLIQKRIQEIKLEVETPDFAVTLPTVTIAISDIKSLIDGLDLNDRQLNAQLQARAQGIFLLIILLFSAIGMTLSFHAHSFRMRVLRPLDQLIRRARQIGDGQYDVVTPTQHKYELGTLSMTLESMARHIRAHQLELEERVAQRSRELLRTARLADLGTLAAGVAHEINNPLAAIATCAEGLLRDRRLGKVTDNDRLRDYLEIIGKEAMRARDTTARLLAFARPESGRREPVWLLHECRSVATMLDHSARRLGVSIRIDSLGIDQPVLGDASDLRQVIFNLLKNALDASPTNSHVDVEISEHDDCMRIAICDQGFGVDQSIGDRIFEPFVTTKSPGSGTGLGLAISHRIVTDHGGNLRATNRPQGGARFAVELPRFRSS
jgi:signal transduction histidine kinase